MITLQLKGAINIISFYIDKKEALESKKYQLTFLIDLHALEYLVRNVPIFRKCMYETQF